MRELRTNTATRITVGPFLDKTDGVTPETTLTVTSEKLTLMVDDAGVPTLILDVAPTASGGANDMVHVTGDDAGFYDLELAAANVNYLGRAILALTDATTHCPVFHEFMILSANEYDSKYSTAVRAANVTQLLGTAWLTPAVAGTPDVNAKQHGGTAQTGRDIGASVLLSSGTGTGQVKLASGYVAPNWGDVGNPTTTNSLTNTTIATVTNVTNAPTAGDFTATQKTSITTACTSSLTSFFTSAATLVTSIWAATTRILTAGTNIVLAKGTGITGFNDIAATAVVSGGAITTSGGAVSNVTTVGMVTALDPAYDAAKTAATQSSVNAVDDFVDTEVAAIKAVTDKLDDTLEDQGGGLYGFTALALQEAPTGSGGSGTGAPSRGVSPCLLKQFETYVLMVFMTDSGTHLGKTGLTLTIETSKAGEAFGTITPTVVPRAHGWYAIILDGVLHVDTIGDFAFHVTGTGANPNDFVVQVRPQVLGDTLTANMTNLAGWFVEADADAIAAESVTFPALVASTTSGGGSGTGLTAAETRAALGMAAPDLDAQLDAIAGKVDVVDAEVGVIHGKVDVIDTEVGIIDDKVDVVDDKVDVIDAEIGVIHGKVDVIDGEIGAIDGQVDNIWGGLIRTTGTVVANGANTALTFKTDLAGGVDYWRDAFLTFKDGALSGQTRRVTGYSSTFITTDGYTGTPAAGATFLIVNV